MKRKLSTILMVFVVLICVISMFGCANEETNNDDDYSIVIKGIGIEDIVITKAQIKEVYKDYPVVYEGGYFAYASDKTDDDGNLIPHTLKGVYLDDVLAKYANGVLSGAYSTATLNAADGFSTILTAETFSEEHGGTKMILAFEYDGVELSPDEKSGAIRAVFPNQPMNSWVKKLKEIIFENTLAEIPNVEKAVFLSALGENFYGSFVSDYEISGTTKKMTNYGISLKKVFESGILTASEDKKMYINAWDYISNGTEGIYRPYESWKTYEYYNNAFLVFETQLENEEIEDEIRAPVFDGENILSGMSVKNVLSLSVDNNALICEDVAFDRFDTDSDNIINFKDLLELVKLYQEDSNYTIVCQDDSTINVTSLDIDNATLTKNENVYNLDILESSYLIKSIEINK